MTTETIAKPEYVPNLTVRRRSRNASIRAELHALLGEAHSYTIQPELVSQLARPRLPELNANNSIDPLDVLKTYLASREDLKDVAESMLEAAQGLLGGDEEVLVEF